jgi:hypothetical protein
VLRTPAGWLEWPVRCWRGGRVNVRKLLGRVSMRAVVPVPDDAPRRRLGSGYRRLGVRSRGSLLLQPCVISRRRRDGRRRGTSRSHRGEAGERHNRGRGKTCASKARTGRFHVVSPGADAADAEQDRLQTCGQSLPFSRRGERSNDGRICSGVSLGDPLPAASASLTSLAMRRESGSSSPCRSAIAMMTPCR